MLYCRHPRGSMQPDAGHLQLCRCLAHAGYTIGRASTSLLHLQQSTLEGALAQLRGV